MSKKRHRSYVIDAPADDLLTYDIGRWATDKYRHLGMYSEIFATGMKNQWDVRVYLDLFSGPGHSKMRGSNQVLLGSPLIALSIPDRFDRYVFADDNGAAIAALKQRVARTIPNVDAHYVVGDANERICEIVGLIPAGGETKKVLSFCFLDPYKLNIHFDTVKQLAEGRSIDFLILLALYVDANRNLDLYIREESTTIDRFLGTADWRGRWETAREDGSKFVAFLAHEYSNSMAGIGYRPMGLDQMVKVRTDEKRLPLYYLAFFSKHPKGVEFWQEVLKYSTDQLPLL